MELNTANRKALAKFQATIATARKTMERQYERLVNRDLSSQRWQGLLQRNVMLSLEQLFALSLDEIERLELTEADADIHRQLLSVYDNIIESFLQFAVQKHRTSCAISNFPSEHKPDNVYIEQVLTQSYQIWEKFSEDVRKSLQGNGLADP